MKADFRTGGVGYGEFKTRLFQTIWDYFEPMRKRRADIEGEPQRIDAVLAEGGARANALASRTMERGRRAVGFG